MLIKIYIKKQPVGPKDINLWQINNLFYRENSAKFPEIIALTTITLLNCLLNNFFMNSEEAI